METVYEVWENCSLEYDNNNVSLESLDGSKRFKLILLNSHGEYAEIPSNVRMTVTNESFFDVAHHISKVKVMVSKHNNNEELKITFTNNNDKSTGNIMFNNLGGRVISEWFYADGCDVNGGSYKFYEK